MLTDKKYLEKKSELARLKNIARRYKIRMFRREIKTNAICSECGENNPNLLEFAHYDRNNKKINFSFNTSITLLQEELEKGRFLCMWCHRLETQKEVDQLTLNHKMKRSYSLEEQNIKLDKKAKISNGPLCNGIMRHSSFFRSTTTCKKCHSVNIRQCRQNKQNYVNRCKLKIGKCEICNIKVEENTTCCFDFDHLDPNNKTKSVSQTDGLNNVKIEISKCRLLCCKCHKIHTIKQLGVVDYNKDEEMDIQLLEARIQELRSIILSHNSSKRKLSRSSEIKQQR